MPESQDVKVLTVWRCPICGYMLDDTDEQWTAGHEGEGAGESAIPPGCHGDAWDAVVHEPEDMERIEVVPRKEAEELAEALDYLKTTARALVLRHPVRDLDEQFVHIDRLVAKFRESTREDPDVS